MFSVIFILTSWIKSYNNKVTYPNFLIILNVMAEYICPNCANPIYDNDALLCHFCGESLQRASTGLLGKLRYSNRKMIWIVIASLALLAFIFLMVF